MKISVDASLDVVGGRRGISTESPLAVEEELGGEASRRRESEPGDSSPTCRGVETSPGEGPGKGWEYLPLACVQMRLLESLGRIGPWFLHPGNKRGSPWDPLQPNKP